jgi:hypothetical protein
MKLLFSLGHWFVALFNPPPRDSLSFAQKTGRVVLVTVVLVTCSLISALAVAVSLFLIQRVEAGRVGSIPLIKVLAILLDSVLVNVVCVFVLLQIKRLDESLIPRGPSPKAPKL